MANVERIRQQERLEEIAWENDPDGKARTYFKEKAEAILNLLIIHSYSRGEACDRLERLRVEVRDKIAAAEKRKADFLAAFENKKPRT